MLLQKILSPTQTENHESVHSTIVNKVFEQSDIRGVIINSRIIVIKGGWCTETLSFHTAMWKKVSKKHIDVVCFTHLPQSNKT